MMAVTPFDRQPSTATLTGMTLCPFVSLLLVVLPLVVVAVLLELRRQ